MIIVRYADDIIVGFQYQTDARRFWDAMRERLGEYALSLHPDKTRLIEFGRFTAVQRARRGLGKPETFKFLGFTFICGRSRRGRFALKRKSRGDRMRAKLKEIKEEMRRRRHQPIPEQGRWLRRSLNIMQCRQTVEHSSGSGTASPIFGGGRSNDAARRLGSRGIGSKSWQMTLFPKPAFFILGRTRASPSNTQGGSRVP
jgi:hypothetical protein